MSEPSQTRTTNALSVKSLVTIGVFAAIYFVVLAACTMMSMISPAFHLVGITLSTLVNAFVVMALLARCPAMGTLTILGAVVTGLMTLMGQFWVSLILGIGAGLLADITRRLIGPASKIGSAISYGIFQLWLIGPLLPVVLTPEAWFARITVRRGADYVAAMEALFTPTNLIIFHVANALLGILFALLAAKSLKRHFQKSSIL
ncbi:MptD family putative ECF transporter S component [Schaalia vaccimaxillae]|uniref:MptD family putative ECF transporter S component n=1 Tax=Schaalia vaccimaxillae TaxID=183916 RepID=UPI0003B6978F|nr:MptD family putative ECF transporter S component [Schaalia vaccimaxillae]